MHLLIYRAQLDAADRDAVALHHEFQNKREEGLHVKLPSGHNGVDREQERSQAIDKLLHQITKITNTNQG